MEKDPNPSLEENQDPESLVGNAQSEPPAEEPASEAVETMASQLPTAPEAGAPPDSGRRNKTSPWLAAGVMGLISLCLSAVVVLGILGLVNGGLAYAPRSKGILLESQLAGVYLRLDEQERDLAALRTRLQALETLNGRVTGMEQENQSLRQEIAKQTKSIDDLQDSIDSLQSELEQVAGRSRDFETFLQGLTELLAGLQSAQEIQP